MLKTNEEIKIVQTEELIKEALSKSKNPAVACSFGKCSTVTLHLVIQQRPNILVIFNNTGVEYPQTLKIKERLKEEWNLNLIETHPYKKNFWQCLDEYGVPSYKTSGGSKFPKCCYYLKEKPASIIYKEKNVDLTFTGMRAEESRTRFLLLEYGLHYDTKYDNPLLYYTKKKMWRCHPIGQWQKRLLDAYIELNQIPISDVYKPPLNLQRSGCMPCTAWINWKRQMARINPKLLKIILKKQGQTQLNFDCKGNIKEAI